MKKTTQSFLVVMLMVFFSFSCNNSENNSNQSKNNEVKNEDSKTETSSSDISGNYKMSENCSCGYELIITKEKDKYSYNIKGNNGILDIFGKLSVSDQNGTTYVDFTFPESFSVKTAQGVFENNTITFENYGNTYNDFTIFEDCSDKFMEFVKK